MEGDQGQEEIELGISSQSFKDVQSPLGLGHVGEGRRLVEGRQMIVVGPVPRLLQLVDDGCQVADVGMLLQAGHDRLDVLLPRRRRPRDPLADIREA